MAHKMAKASVTELSDEAVPFQRWRDIPHIPATDNEAGAPETLLKANKSFALVDGLRHTIGRGTK